VFAAKGLKTYASSMPFRFCRRLVAMTTALLFLLSAVGHNFVVSAMADDAGMKMSGAASDMPSHDDTPPCPTPSDCLKDLGMQMACFSHCATVLGILSETVLVPVSIVGHKLDLPVVPPLASLHRLPEPHPPKPLILV